MIDFNLRMLKVNGKKIEFLYPGVKIQKIAITDDSIIIVHLDVSGLFKKGEDENIYRNIFAVDMNCNILWQIEPSVFSQAVRGKILRYNFLNSWLTDDGRLMADDGHVEYEVDLKTGKLGKGELAK